MGLRGRWDGGGVPGRRGLEGLGVGGEAVRRWFKTYDIFCHGKKTVD